jgi:hypothetical protein
MGMLSAITISLFAAQRSHSHCDMLLRYPYAQSSELIQPITKHSNVWHILKDAPYHFLLITVHTCDSPLNMQAAQASVLTQHVGQRNSC